MFYKITKCLIPVLKKKIKKISLGPLRTGKNSCAQVRVVADYADTTITTRTSTANSESLSLAFK